MAKTTIWGFREGCYGPIDSHLVLRSDKEWRTGLRNLHTIVFSEDPSIDSQALMEPYSNCQPPEGLVLHKYSSEAMLEGYGIDPTVRAVLRGLEEHVLVDHHLCTTLLKIPDFGRAVRSGRLTALESYREKWAITHISHALELVRATFPTAENEGEMWTR